jgi:hypothetical protein
LGVRANEGLIMSAISVTLSNGHVIEFEAGDATQDVSTSYAVDGAGVLTIESRRMKSAGELVITHQRFSPAAWHCVEEADMSVPCAVPPWVSGVIGSSAACSGIDRR